MPLHWHILHDEQLVKLKTEGALRLDDVIVYLDALHHAGALGYRKLTDAREGYSDMTEGDLMSLLGMGAGYSQMKPLGPNAFIVSTESANAHRPVLQRLFVDKSRELKMFTDAEQALEWIREQPVSG